MIYRYITVVVLLFFADFACFSQNIRNNIVADINTDPRSTSILDFMDFGGKTYLLIAGVTEEVPAEYTSHKKVQLAAIDHTTGQFSIIKEDRVTFPGDAILGKFYKTSSNYFYFVISNHMPTDIWYSDGTSAGTQKKANYEQVDDVIGVMNNDFYFHKEINNDSNFEVRKIVANNAPVAVTTGQNMVYKFTYAGTDKVYFATVGEGGNVSIKAMDANGNIVVLKTMYDYMMYAVGEANGKFVFTAAGTYATDGTVAGTTKISDLNLVSWYDPATYRLKTYLYVAPGGKIWATDGTAAHTSDVVSWSSRLLPFNIGDNLYYVLDNDLFTFKARETNNITHTKLHDSLAVKSFAIAPDSSKVYFGADNGQVWQYVKSTSAFIKLNADFENIERMACIGHDLFVVGKVRNSNLGTQLYVYKNNVFSVYRFLNTNTEGRLAEYVRMVDKYLVYKAERRTSEPVVVFTQGLPENTIVIPDTTSRGLGWEFFIKNDSVFYSFDSEGVREINLKTRSHSSKKLFATHDYAMKTVKVNQRFVLIHQDELYEYNPSNHSQTLIKRFPNALNFWKTEFTLFQNKWYFFVNGSDGYELWQTDGTITGTKLLKTFLQNNNATMNLGFFEVNNTLVMLIRIDYKSYLWKTDGTVAGTTFIADMKGMFDLEFRGHSNLTSDGKNLYFALKVIENGSGAMHLYRTNNAMNGLEFLMRSDEIYETYNLCNCANSIYFLGDYPRQLWKYDIAAATLSKIGPEFSAGFYEDQLPACLGNTLWMPRVEYSPHRGEFIEVVDLTTGQSKRIMQAVISTNYPYSRPIENGVLVYNNSVVYRRDDYKYGNEMFIAGLCEDTNTRNSISLTGTYYHTEAVTSTEKIVLPTAVNLFSARNITLMPGFEAKSGSVFYANIKQCK
ncbi:3-coathanger stack domain-containing protein [Emticicia sp. C21]|uniref:3-coathanger stack domain-containing protein n=1 Tax=Emticicia sp. C21 TaxID=2302915 RepID=UPI000E3464AC|nr:3-coathanger stack domain-containing protein [Emticicia sp. C21]RFS16976.1 hypothetical protein D0T08_09880 [Emticicia sp. C21]